jgi:hypothetical protein
MLITQETVAAKLAAYLRYDISLPQLVDLAERALLEGEFAEADTSILSQVVARLGVADVRAFALTWEDCEQLLSAGFARNPLRIAEWGLRNPQSEIRNPKFLPPCDDFLK